MAFEKLYFDCDKNSSKLIQDIINIILDNNDDLDSIFECSGIKNIHYQKISKLFINAIKTDDYPLSSYTPKRLLIAMERYLENRSKQDLFEELLARFYYDSCLEGKRIEMDFPPLLQIEISSRCNYKCIFCYQIDSTFSDPKSEFMGFMDFDLFKNIIDQIEGSIPYITFASRGEPTLHPKFIEMLDYCKGKFKDIKINTNASTLTKNKIEKIIEICDTVVFSIDSPNKEIYPKIRIGGNFDRVLKNIDLFNKIRSIHPRGKKVNSRASGVLYDKENQSMEEYKKVFSPLFDETAFVQYNPWEKIYSLPENDITKPCQQPFFRFFAWFDGSFNCCDMDYKSELSKNSQKISAEYTIGDAWNSEIMKSIRHLHHTGQRNSLEPCKRCPIEPSK